VKKRTVSSPRFFSNIQQSPLRRSDFGNKMPAAFCTSAGQNFSASGGSHSGTETDGFIASANIRSISR
jgi:hypothetical protein